MTLRKHLDPDGGDESPVRHNAQAAHQLPGRTRPRIRCLGSLVADRSDRLDGKFIIGRVFAERLKDCLSVLEWPDLDPMKAHRGRREQQLAKRLEVTRSKPGVVRLDVGGEQLPRGVHTDSVARHTAKGAVA